MTQSKAESCLQGIASRRFKEGSLDYSPAQIAYIAREDRVIFNRMKVYTRALESITPQDKTNQKIQQAAQGLLGKMNGLDSFRDLSPKEVNEGRKALFSVRGFPIKE